MQGTVPGILLFDSFKLYGSLDTYNIDGAGGNTMLSGKYILVRDGTDSTANLIGCTAATIA